MGKFFKQLNDNSYPLKRIRVFLTFTLIVDIVRNIFLAFFWVFNIKDYFETINMPEIIKTSAVVTEVFLILTK